MIAQESLKDLLSRSDYSREEKLLICLGVDAASAKQVSEVRALAADAGLPEAKRWNISDVLARARGIAVRTRDGWELTSDGRKRVALLVGAFVGTVAPRVAAGLRHQLAGIADADTREFLDEALKCFEAGLYRAAVVFAWVGAVAVLQDHVIAKRVNDFNTEAARRDPKWKPAVTRDDLSRMKEFDFLQVLEGISVIGKSLKHELEAALKLRNGAGHPNALKIGEARAAGHLESLVLNVFSKY